MKDGKSVTKTFMQFYFFTKHTFHEDQQQADFRHPLYSPACTWNEKEAIRIRNTHIHAHKNK